MNIFLLSHETNPYRHFVEQAKFHCDKHVIKMIAETTQIIVTALSTPLAKQDLLPYYKLTLDMSAMRPDALPCKPLSSGHAKHPCVLWAKQDIEHVYYLVRLATALCAEKQRRWPIKADHEYQSWLTTLLRDFARIGFDARDRLPLSFPVAVKDASLSSTNQPQAKVVAIYRSYYAKDKANFATWRNPACKPIWFILECEALTNEGEQA